MIPIATLILAIKTQVCACLAEHINFSAPLEPWIWIYTSIPVAKALQLPLSKT